MLQASVKISRLHRKIRLYFKHKLYSLKIKTAKLFPRTGKTVFQKLKSLPKFQRTVIMHFQHQCPQSKETRLPTRAVYHYFAIIRTNKFPSSFIAPALFYCYFILLGFLCYSFKLSYISSQLPPF